MYFEDELPAFFERTLRLDEALRTRTRLSWIFTGPHAGFTVQLSSSKVRVIQRFYDSTVAGTGQGNYPERVVQDEEQQITGTPRTLTVVLDNHLSLRVLVNGTEVLRQRCVFDVGRHQLMFVAPRSSHEVMKGELLKETARNAQVRVVPSEKHQEMLGFGGSPSIPAYARLSQKGKALYWAMLKRNNLLLDREYPMGAQLKPDLSNLENLKDATPHYYGDNFPNGEVSSFEYSRRAQEMGGAVVYEMWALPAWASEGYEAQGAPTVDAWGKQVRTAAKVDEYARAMVEYCRLAKLRSGRPPAIVGVQNEVEQPPEVFDKMVLTLRRELDRAGFASVRIHMADASYMDMGIERAKRLQHDPAVWKAIDYAATHEYDYQEFFANPDMYDERMRQMRRASGDKPFIATEICINDPAYQEASYRIAFNVGQLYYKNLTVLDAVSLMYCWLLLDVEQPSFGGSRSLLVADRSRDSVPVASSFELRMLSAFSRHVLKGMRRVTTTSDDADLLTTGFAGDGKQSVLLVNRSTHAETVSVDWSGATWRQIERTSPYLENATSDVVPRELTVEPGEIVVLSNFKAAE